ncbi:MAG: hypothetical protein JRN15_12695 [Nitrososphaerota archaeon]|nr:hypothetical protein [Nitrososphaerota archaeon]
MAEQVKAYVVQLTPEEAEMVRREVTGEGGWQSHQRKLQTRLSSDNKISLTKHLIQKTREYASKSHGPGGWEQVLDGVLNACERAGIHTENP